MYHFTSSIYNLYFGFCRRLLHDDGRGVDEALNETVCVTDKCAGLTVSEFAALVLILILNFNYVF